MSSSGMVDTLLSKTQLKPGWNGYQYLMVFLVGFVVDLIIHYFANRKYYSQGQLFGFAEGLVPWYRSVGSMGLLGSFESEYIRTFNKWALGALIGGLICVVVLAIADLALQIADWVESSKA